MASTRSRSSDAYERKIFKRPDPWWEARPGRGGQGMLGSVEAKVADPAPPAKRRHSGPVGPDRSRRQEAHQREDGGDDHGLDRQPPGPGPHRRPVPGRDRLDAVVHVAQTARSEAHSGLLAGLEEAHRRAEEREEQAEPPRAGGPGARQERPEDEARQPRRDAEKASSAPLQGPDVADVGSAARSGHRKTLTTRWRSRTWAGTRPPRWGAGGRGSPGPRCTDNLRGSPGSARSGDRGRIARSTVRTTGTSRP